MSISERMACVLVGMFLCGLAGHGLLMVVAAHQLAMAREALMAGVIAALSFYVGVHLIYRGVRS